MEAAIVTEEQEAAIFAEVDREDARAQAVCDKLLVGPSSKWMERFRNAPEAREPGVVRHVLGRVHALLDRRPADALQATSIAMAVADVLDPRGWWTDYVETVRAQAMRDHAYVLAFMGRFEEALKYAERSGQTFAMVDAMSFDLARLALVKAFIVRMLNRSGEALQLTREAAAIFLRLGERARHVNARMTEGAILYDAGALEEALGVFRSLEGNPHLDAISEVRITHNIATCLCDLGRQAEAVAPLERCMAEYSRLGMLTERARCRWYLGNARLGAGCPSEGIFLLRAASRELAELEMTSDAALAALDLADALIATGNAAEALPICRQVIVELTDAGLPEQATRALMTLHEAVAMGALSREVIRSTHAEVRNARRRVGLQRLHGLA